MSPEFFNWSPFVALGLGLLAGLAALRSLNGALCLTVAAILAQALGWGIVFAFAGQNRDWNAPFLAGSWEALIVVTPYTTLGAFFGAWFALMLRYLAHSKGTAGGKGGFMPR